MRLAFVRALVRSAEKIKKLHLLTADLGFEVFEEFIDKYPKKYTNAGVSEANMVSLAAGMAKEGFKVICYSIVPFLTYRAFEQIRNDVCYPEMDVKIVGVGGGFSYSYNGPSHCAIEDICLMRSLPNMTVVCPSDPLEAYQATIQMLKMNSPVYLRLGKKGESNLTENITNCFRLGKIREIKKGKDLVIFTTGNMLETSMNVAESLGKSGINTAIINVHTLKPLDKKGIGVVIRNHTKLVTIEEHSIIGGLGSAVAEVNVSNPGYLRKQLIVGVPDKYYNVAGSHNYWRKLSGLDPVTIFKRILKWL